MAYQEMSYKVSIFAVSDVGLVRYNNEDSWKHLPEDQFYVLADGMGGHQAGEIASRMAVDGLCALFQENHVKDVQEIANTKNLLYQIIQDVNACVHRKGQEGAGLKGMGTTLCCIYLHPDGLVYAHVGDSRIYRLRGQLLEQLTHDHSLLQELIDLGELSKQQAEEFHYKNVITKAIGTQFFVDPVVKSSNLLAGDTFLMCSDGLTDLVSKDEIQKILLQYSDEEAAAQLVSLAKSRGGYDNITVLIIKVLSTL
jgi:protein phosphatase